MALTLPETVLHGGDLDAAHQQFPSAPEPWIDLSTGINPQAYPLPQLSPEAWSRLPLKSDEWSLREIAARHYGAADPSMIVPAPGAQSLIQIIPRLRGVMLDSGEGLKATESEDADIYWGAYLGTEYEILVSGKMSEVAGEIQRIRKQARAERGWIMDTYLLRRNS